MHQHVCEKKTMTEPQGVQHQINVRVKHVLSIRYSKLSCGEMLLWNVDESDRCMRVSRADGKEAILMSKKRTMFCSTSHDEKMD